MSGFETSGPISAGIVKCVCSAQVDHRALSKECFRTALKPCLFSSQLTENRQIQFKIKMISAGKYELSAALQIHNYNCRNLFGTAYFVYNCTLKKPWWIRGKIHKNILY